MIAPQSWDCIVVGAGPAGAIAAREVASRGFKVLLVDKNSFPRYKVCGCCINGSAQDALSEAGLLHVLNDNNAVPLQHLRLFDGKKNASIQLPAGLSLSRSRFDAALIDAAVEAGVTFLERTNASVLNNSRGDDGSIGEDWASDLSNSRGDGSIGEDWALDLSNSRGDGSVGEDWALDLSNSRGADGSVGEDWEASVLSNSRGADGGVGEDWEASVLSNSRGADGGVGEDWEASVLSNSRGADGSVGEDWEASVLSNSRGADGGVGKDWEASVLSNSRGADGGVGEDWESTEVRTDGGVDSLVGAGADSSLEAAAPRRKVRLQTEESIIVSEAKMVIVADGLAGNSLNELADFEPYLEKQSRFGAGVILEDGPSFYERGQIYMACGTGGYVGLVRLEDNRLDVAAAFDQAFSRALHGPANAATQLLQSCAMPVPNLLREAQWTGTQPLTRRRKRIAAERLIITGDACGYPEPFTGEGIAWALWSGLLGGRLAIDGIRSWHPRLLHEWVETNRRFKRQQSRSRLIAMGLRNNMVRRLMLQVLSKSPGLASPVVRIINQARFHAHTKIRAGAR